MLASTIVYFSLLSASWMSGVSAVLDQPHRAIVDTFLDRIRAGQSLAVAYSNTLLEHWIANGRQPNQHFEEALEAYFRHEIDILNNHVDNYRRPTNIRPNIVYDTVTNPLPARDRDFVLAWNEIPYFVYRIRYSNLLILNGLKQDMIRRGLPISPQSILAVIDDDYVREVSVEHRDQNVPPADRDSFESHITNIVKLFSINKEMLDRNQFPSVLRDRLAYYQVMIRDLHYGMARNMQIETRPRYQAGFTALGSSIHVLSSNLDIHGYHHDQVIFFVEILSKSILWVIEIYAGHTIPDGREIISGLLETQPVVRHFMSLDRHASPDTQLADIADELLAALEPEIRAISVRYQEIYLPGYAWMITLEETVDVLRQVGGRRIDSDSD